MINGRKLRLYATKKILEVRTSANAYVAKKDMKKNLKNGRKYEGSIEELNKKVVPYWKKYDYKPNIKWYQFYGERTQQFNPKYIPDDLFQKEIFPYLNNLTMQPTLENKFYFDQILQGIRKPKNIIKYVNKLFLDEKNQIIIKEGIYLLLKKYEKVVIKPINEGKGSGVKILYPKDKFEEAKNIIENRIKIGQQFLIQEYIEQSAQLKKLNSSSLNTLRIVSLILDSEIVILSRIVRIGQKGSEVDNLSMGGDGRAVTPQGYLVDYTYNKSGYSKFDRDGNELDYEKLIGYEEAIELVKKYHPRFPHLRWLGWDFGINNKGEPILIEINGFAIHNQKIDGPMFAEFTDKVLDEFFEYRNNKRLKNNNS